MFTLSSGPSEVVGYALKLDPNGTFAWARAFGNAAGAGAIGQGVAVDNADVVHVSGTFFGTVDFDPGPATFTLTGGGIAADFVLDLDAGGNFISADAVTATSILDMRGLTTDAARDVFLTGDFGGTADFDPGPGVVSVTSASSGAAFILKLVPGGGPATSVPRAQTTPEDTPLVLSTANSNRLSLTGADIGSSLIRVRLIATNGTLTLAATSGLTFSEGDGTADPAITVSGTLTALNAALDGLRFTPDANFNGSASLQITAFD